MSNFDFNNEEWLDVPGFEGLYMVSDFGRLKSIERYVKNKAGTKLLKGRILSQKKDKDGYMNVSLSKDNKQKTFKIHRIVLRAFIGESSLVADHINANRSDNRLVNLRYCTTRQNATYGALRKSNSSKYTGVSLHKRTHKYSANIMVDGKKKHLGNFDNELEASNAYQAALSALTQ